MKIMIRTPLAFLSSLLAAHVLWAGTPPANAGRAPAQGTREAVVVYYDHTEPSITFSAQELQKTFRGLGHDPATLRPLAELPVSPDPSYVVIAKNTSLPVLTLLRDRGGQGTGAMGEQAYALRITRKTGEARHQTEAVAHLEKALTAWHDYAKELDANYTNKLFISGQKTFDWFDDSGPRSDIEIARKRNP